jgi:hypothetical protein
MDADLIEANIESWVKELPVKRILMGINHFSKVRLVNNLKKKFPMIEIINQLEFKTLGGCLADLIKRVKTEWYIYVHSDVRITPKAFCILREYMMDNVGIIESHREHWDGEYRRILENDKYDWLPQRKASDYYDRNRSFSGLQIIRKEAIMSLVDRLEDDYLYRNEDMIFHAECVKNGFEYQKTWAMHIHQITNTKWTFEHEATHHMQFRGFVKYTKPNEITITPCLAALGLLKRKYKYKIYAALEFCYKWNSNWAECIVEKWDEL